MLTRDSEIFEVAQWLIVRKFDRVYDDQAPQGPHLDGVEIGTHDHIGVSRGNDRQGVGRSGADLIPRSFRASPLVKLLISRSSFQAEERVESPRHLLRSR